MILGGYADEIEVPLCDLRRSIATRFYSFSRDRRLQSLLRMSTCLKIEQERKIYSFSG